MEHINFIFSLFEAIYLLSVYTFALLIYHFLLIILILMKILWEYKPLATSQEILLLKFLFLLYNEVMT